MDQISRRSFLKGAGMTALAVAAVGMMTGCKGEDFVPDPQKVDVAVIFCRSGMGVESNLPTARFRWLKRQQKKVRQLRRLKLKNCWPIRKSGSWTRLIRAT